ncbi:Potassium transporter 5 [Fusarium oxysporum f. sp. albedinis]|nr:Potassium transporter 5 [Fusarium oxysporum f. sp. albedinis]
MQRRCQGQFDFGLRLTNKNCMDFTRTSAFRPLCDGSAGGKFVIQRDGGSQEGFGHPDRVWLTPMSLPGIQITLHIMEHSRLDSLCLFDRQTAEVPKLEGWDNFEKRRRGCRSALRLMMSDR